MANHQRSKSAPLWAITIMLLIIVGSLVLFRDVIFGTEQATPPAEPPSTEWTTAPEDGVPVDLPNTPVRAVPIEDTNAEDKADPDQE